MDTIRNTRIAGRTPETRLQPSPGGAVTPQLHAERFSPGEHPPGPGIMPGNLSAMFPKNQEAAPPAPADPAGLASLRMTVQMNSAASCASAPRAYLWLRRPIF